MTSSRRDPGEIAEVRAFCLATAALVERGVPVASWCSAVAELGAGRLLSVALELLGHSGLSFGEALLAACEERLRSPPGTELDIGAAQGWLRVCAVLLLAEETGAPLAEGLRSVADWTDREQRWDVRRREALAGPLATSRMLALLPALSLGMTLFSGEGAVRMLFTTPLGWVLIALSGSLTAAGLCWRGRILRRVRVRAGSGLWALPPALRVGVSISRVRAAAERSFLRCGLPGLDTESLRGVEETSARTGTPAVILVDELIREEHRKQETAFIGVAARAETALLLPIALCHLPAFVLVGVVPLVVGLLSTLRW